MTRGSLRLRPDRDLNHRGPEKLSFKIITSLKLPQDRLVFGIFGLDSRGARARIRPSLRRMFGWSRVGMAANFLSQRSLEPAEARVYVDPAEALEIGLALTPAVRIDHSYLPNDFTLCLDKVPAWERGPGGRDEKSV